MIPYYAKNTGIQTDEESNAVYVVLDKIKVDDMDVNVWNTFESVKLQVENEMKEFLYISEASIAISPDGDGTYVLNFVTQEIFPSEGAVL